MKLPTERDWPATLFLAILALVVLVFATLDPSCYRYPAPRAESQIRAR